jgi:hypothetical protein
MSGVSEPIGTGTPDEIEREILRIATTMPEPARAGNWGSGLWTKSLLLAIGQLGKQHHCYVCGCREVEPEQGRWLFDLAWLGEHDMPLALESEWGDQEAVDRDFQKLVLARADHRVMIFEAPGADIDRHFERFAEQIRTCRYTQSGDRYLFLAYDWDAGRFNFQVFVASAPVGHRAALEPSV